MVTVGRGDVGTVPFRVCTDAVPAEHRRRPGRQVCNRMKIPFSCTERQTWVSAAAGRVDEYEVKKYGSIREFCRGL